MAETASEADAPSQAWWVYIVETESGKLYTGISTDVERRFAEHSDSGNKKKTARGARYFRMDPPKAVVWRQQMQNRSEASKLEAAIKKMSAKKKRELIAGGISVSS